MKLLRRAGVLLWVPLLVALLLVRVPTAHAQNTQNFRITSFSADYYLDRTADKVSTMKVVEHIDALFPDYDQNHGILRAIPEGYQGHTVSLQIDSVTDGTAAWNYTTSHSNDNLVLKIGDANRYVHGPQTYVITYTMRNVVSILGDHDELYWDVNGDQWQQSFGLVEARIHIPAGLTASLQEQQRCLAGSYGQTSDNRCTIARTAEADGGTLVTAQATNLYASETLTYVLAFNQGTFVPGPEIRAEKRQQLVKKVLIGLAIVVPPVAALLILLPKWRRIGRDPKGRGVIIPEYVPPKGLSVVDSDFVLREGVGGKTVTAQIIDLAVRGYLTIYETTKKKLLKDQKNYELELNKVPDSLSPQEQQIVEALFDEPVVGARVQLDTLKNKLYTTVSSLGKDTAKSLTEAGYFKSNPKKAGSGYAAGGALLLIVGFLTATLFVGMGLILAGTVTLVFAAIMPARTEQGVTMRDYLLGLKEYISIAEKDRIKFLQSPEGAEKIQATGIDPRDVKQKVKLFETLLPYAMLFGLEKEWAKQFADLYQEPPNWYRGNWATFNAVYLASSLGGFSTASTASFSAPASSSSSGFGGGGFSGGGGGGGGGGGW